MTRRRPPDDDDDDLFAWSERFGSPARPANRIEAEFWEWHALNPHIYELVCYFMQRAIDANVGVSISLVIERIRWRVRVETRGDDFKINNNFRAYYARLWRRDHPEHAHFLEIRRTREPTSVLLEPKGGTP